MPLKKTVIGSRQDLVHGTDGFLGRNDHSIPVPLDLTQFTNKEIDSDGYLKPYIPIARDYGMVGSGDYVYGVTVEPVKVAEDNESATIAGLGTVDIAIELQAFVVRHYAEDVLDRSYTSDEVAGFAAAGSRSVLIF